MSSRSYFTDPAITPFCKWPPANQGLFRKFQEWLTDTGYGESALNIYGVAARLALGLLNKAYWTIDANDFEQVHQYIGAYYASAGTRVSYHKGLLKFEHFLRLKCHTPAPPKEPNWAYHFRDLPDWLQVDVKAHVQHYRRRWPTDRQHHLVTHQLSYLCRCLRWLHAQQPLDSPESLTPTRWLAYVDTRLENGIHVKTINQELYRVQCLLRWWVEQGRPINRKLLTLEKFKVEPDLPKDVPIEQLRRLWAAIEQEAGSSRAATRRMGLMDKVWFLLMLHSGLRTGEVRRLKQGDILWETRQVRIEASKGLNDRHVYLSSAALDALKAWLAIRGPERDLPENLLVFRHLPLTRTYCRSRLVYYGRKCGVTITPHQLRHSCASLLLNAGAPILTVQALLGHQHIDTTLGYTRLYDGTIAAEYYRAMAQVERRMALPEDQRAKPMSVGEMVALVDSLRSGTLNETQLETVRVLRAGLLSIAGNGKASAKFKANGKEKTR